jgi:DNA-binding response OmpR family regulator
MRPRVTARTLRSDRLLEGEDPKTGFPQDARHWIAVYSEMIAFKNDVLGRMRTRVRRLPRAARADVMTNDVEFIENQLGRYQRRLEYWYARQWQLEGLRIDEDTRTIAYRSRSVHLTRRELQLLTTLAGRSPHFLVPQQLLVLAWENAGLPEETLRTYIVRLRNKLVELGAPAEIPNQPRRGYALLFKDRTGSAVPD